MTTASTSGTAGIPIPEGEPVPMVDTESKASSGRGRGRKAALITGALLVAIAAGVALGVLLPIGDQARTVPRPDAPRAVSPQDLRALPEKTGHVVYWAGTIPGTRLELTENRSGSIFVRYLTEGAAVGDERPAFTTVATYLTERAYQVTEGDARKRGNVSEEAPGGGIAVWSEKSPEHVYVAYPGSDYLVEVFDPTEGRARDLALAGDVGPIR